MPKRVRARTWRPPLPRPAGGPDAAEAARRVARTGRAAIRRQHPYSLRARRGRSLPRCGKLTFRTPTRHRAQNQQPGRILIPGDGAAGDQGAQNRPVYATPAACPVSTTSWRYGLRRTCRLVTGRSHRPRSTWPNQARLALLAVTHRYKRTHCLWLEQFQIADYARVVYRLTRWSPTAICAGYVRGGFMPLVVRMAGACDWQGGVFRQGVFDRGVPARFLTVTARAGRCSHLSACPLGPDARGGRDDTRAEHRGAGD